MSRDYTKQDSRWHVAIRVQVGSDLDNYNYMVVYNL